MISLVRLSLLKNNYVVSFKICPDEKDGATRCGYGHPSQVNKKIYKINFKKKNVQGELIIDVFVLVV